MTKANKSPVVYWTSQWEETGKIEVCVDKNGDKYTRPQLRLIGERNSNWKSIATRH
ncbi:MAG: hypothetical protein ACKVJK_13105 [Methylophagaceae bacterium]|jgi:hypothetical protein